MPEPVIRVRQLTKRFPVRRRLREIFDMSRPKEWTTALNGVDLHVNAGEIFGLLGANGAGKTTLVKILSTLLLPSTGDAEILGCDVVKSPGEIRRAVGWCLDTERSFYYRLSGVENLSFFAALNNVGKREAASRISEVLEIVGLAGAAHRPFRTFSRGMQHKLGLARALLANPPILLLDEPTKSLDPRAAFEFRGFIRSVLAQQMKKTILIVTHSLAEAEYCCDRLGMMEHGRISSTGTWREMELQIRQVGFENEVSGRE